MHPDEEVVYTLYPEWNRLLSNLEAENQARQQKTITLRNWLDGAVTAFEMHHKGQKKTLQTLRRSSKMQRSQVDEMIEALTRNSGKYVAAYQEIVKCVFQRKAPA